jgi:hypothetical protein
MLSEALHPLPPDMLEQFAAKSREGGPDIPQSGNANGVKVRRITQLLIDLTGQPAEQLSVLDLQRRAAIPGYAVSRACGRRRR